MSCLLSNHWSLFCLVLIFWLYPTAAVPAGGITAEKLFHMMKDQTITVIVMDARSHTNFEESHIQVPVQTCISVPEEAISPGWGSGLENWLHDCFTRHCMCNFWFCFWTDNNISLCLMFYLLSFHTLFELLNLTFWTAFMTLQNHRESDWDKATGCVQRDLEAARICGLYCPAGLVQFCHWPQTGHHLAEPQRCTLQGQCVCCLPFVDLPTCNFPSGYTHVFVHSTVGQQDHPAEWTPGVGGRLRELAAVLPHVHNQR